MLLKVMSLPRGFSFSKEKPKDSAKKEAERPVSGEVAAVEERLGLKLRLPPASLSIGSQSMCYFGFS